MSKVSWNSSFHLLFISVILLCVADQVYSGVTSSFIRSKWPAVDIPIDSEEFAVPKDQNALQQVHITQGDYDGKAVIVSWVTITDPGTSEVLYGKSQNKYDHSAQGKTTNYTYYDYKSGYIHHCLLDGLEDLVTGIKIGSGHERGGIYYLDDNASNAGLVAEQSDSTLLWHWRLGRPSLQKLRSVVSV